MVRPVPLLSLCVSRWCGGGLPPLRQCYLSDSRSAAGAWGWGDHALLWRPASWLLSARSCRLHCSSDLGPPRDLTLHLHASGPHLSAAPHHRLRLRGPGYLFKPQHHGAKGEAQLEQYKALSHATKRNMAWAVPTHGVKALCFTILVKKINF